jgi:large repetitive protein
VNGCVNAEMTDPLPSYLTIVGTPTVAGTSNYDLSGTTSTALDVKRTDPLGGGQVGLLPGNVVVVQMQVQVDNPLPTDLDGTQLTNTATVNADNANPKNANATVQLNVPSTVAASTTKTIDPAGGPNDVSFMAHTVVQGTNTSNVPVSQLVISDPVLDDNGNPPGDNTNPFAFLRISQVNSVTPPAGADTVQLRVFDSASGQWVDGPVLTPATELPTIAQTGVDPADVRGLQLVYTDTDGGGIPAGASAKVDVETSLRNELTPEQQPLVVTNTANTTVTTPDGTSATSDPADATYRVPPSTLDVSAGKSFSPSTVHVGDTSTVTVTGKNDSDDPLQSMTITEPAQNTANNFAGQNPPWTFTSIGTNGNGIEWPNGATAATITYQCAGVAGAPQSTTTVDTLPAPPAGCDPVTGFSVTFTGSIESGATATIPFVITTNTDQPLEEMTRTNTVQVNGQANGSSGDATATASITTIKDRIATETSKKIIPSEVPGYPGEIVTAELSGKVSAFPASTVDAKTITVQDPADFATDEWYDTFNPQAVTATAVPACSTLTVEYTTDEGANWAPVPTTGGGTMSDIHGATIYSAVIPDDVGQAANGIRFVYTADPAGGACTGGFPPGTSVSPNLSYTYDGALLTTGTTITDCAASSVTSATTSPAASAPACDDVILDPVDPGTISPIAKAWDIDSVPERSQSQAGATISWSTAGYTGTGRIDITDTANPDTTPLAQSVFDAFDLVRVDPITPALDPLMTYDQIARFELYELPVGGTDPTAGQWVEPADDPCPTLCDGTFPGYTLSTAQRAVVIGYRLTYVESPTRADRIDSPTAPPVGSGVSASTGNNRHIHAVFQLRDARRSIPSVPVIADMIYNTADDGLVDNTVRGDPYWNFDDPTPILTRTANDTILITPVNITATSSKTWTGGPLGIPETGVPQSLYPTSVVTVSANNTSPSKVDQLVITDPDTSNQGPTSCTTSAFDTFNLTGFSSITDPATIGASNVVVTISRGTVTTDYTRAQALALTEADLVDATGMTIAYTGRINAGTTGAPTTASATFTVRLRTDNRTTGAAPQPGAVCNQTKANASDMVGFPGYTDSADAYSQATINLVRQGIGVAAGKTFSPTSITEPSKGPVTVTLAGRPSGPSRTVQMVLEDASPTFFNQYDLAALSPITWVSPVNQVRVDAYVGGTWSVVGGVPVVSGGAWIQGTSVTTAPATAVVLPPGVTASQVQGLRFTFRKSDGSNWENPANPLQTAKFTVTRRDTLNTGGPVPSDLAGSTPAPGETVAGVATDKTTATVTSSDVDAAGNPLTASGTATATVLYRHATNSVMIRKTPNGSTVVPGLPFKYTVTTTNTGSVPITNPVFTDVFPTDNQGPQIELADTPAYSFAITGGTGMPTDASEVTVDATSTRLVFTFPDGSTLPAGATYTISFFVVTRPGLPANTVFTNAVGVTGDRPWDACNGGSGGGLDPATGQCRTVAPNTVTSAGAVAVSKQVKAQGSDVLGTTVDPLAPVKIACQPNAAGFYVRPCIPIAQPGGDITWRLHFTNSGNLPLDRILGIDRLPEPGDAVATAPDLARGSQWEPLLTGARPALVGGAGTFNVYFTTATTGWCDGPQGATGSLLCPALNWQVWPDGQTLPVAPSSVTGIQVEYLPTGALAPAGTFDVDVDMTAPAYSPADTPNTTAMSTLDTFAYNTVGVSARIAALTAPAAAPAVADVVAADPAAADPAADDDPVDPAPPVGVSAPGAYTLTTEPPRVGVALAHGGVRVEKLVDGPGESFAPAVFPATVTCTSAGVDVPIPDDVANLLLTPGEPVTVYDLPYHATCTLTEGENGQSSSSSTTATVQREVTQFQTATLTNTFDAGALQIVKEIRGSGAASAAGPFVFEVACTLDGEEQYSGTVTLHRSGSETTLTSDVIAPLRVGTDCTVTETQNGGADETPPPVTVTILPSRNGVVQVATATFVNTFTAPPLPVTGGAAPATWFVVLALGLLLLGLVLVIIRRRRAS